jgi:peptide/nickel transport system substrate-binding protein
MEVDCWGVAERTIEGTTKKPFRLLIVAIATSAGNCYMMPERLATRDPFKVSTEGVGSGPFR